MSINGISKMVWYAEGTVGKNLTIATVAAWVSLFVLQVPDARAWGCFATAANGSYGWSHRYPSQAMAKSRALTECHKGSPGGCKIVECKSVTQDGWKSTIAAFKARHQNEAKRVVNKKAGEKRPVRDQQPKRQAKRKIIKKDTVRVPDFSNKPLGGAE